MRKLIPALALLVSACASNTQPEASPSLSFTPPADARCASDAVAIDTEFAAGALDSCEVAENGNVTIVIAPEDEPPINCSAWYAFRVTPAAAQDIKIKLTYQEGVFDIDGDICGHRYWPKISYDAVNWEFLPPSNVVIDEFAGRDYAKLKIESDGRPFFISAQEIVVPATYDAWLDGIESHSEASRHLLGRSREGRKIELLTIGDAEAQESIVLVGRQHPPEVTGALAMFPFMETLLGDDELTQRFRKRFRVYAVPLLNPDGVVHGHWRHNTGGVDLNRDWGPFAQPETQLMRDLLVRIENSPVNDLRLMLDFHSTSRDLFYTFSDDMPSDPEFVMRDWLNRFQERMGDYQVDRQIRFAVEGNPISRAYAFGTYGAPAATYELGDETDRELIKKVGRESAIAMMEVMLETPEE